MTNKPVEILEFASGAEWESWLEQHAQGSDEAWLRISKRNSQLPGISIEQALDGALCFGWIDGQRRSLDGDAYLQRYSPRRRASSWSQVNVNKFEALAAAGRVRGPGFAAVAEAQADGRWAAAYAPQSTADTPHDLQLALDAVPRAAEAFKQLDRTARYAVVLEILKSRTTPRRETLIARAVERLASGP